MSEPTEKINPLEHPYWDPSSATSKEVSLMTVARKRARIAGIVMILSVGIGIYSAIQHVEFIGKPQTFVGILPSGWLFSGKPEPLRLTEGQIIDTWRQIVEAHFARTDKGGLPGLEDFSTKDTIEGVNALLSKGSDSAYMISFAVVEDRLGGKTATKAILNIRGRLTIVDSKRTASSEVFLLTFFQRGPASYNNITGWRLGGIKKITREEFYSKERAEVREQLFGNGSDNPNAP